MRPQAGDQAAADFSRIDVHRVVPTKAALPPWMAYTLGPFQVPSPATKMKMMEMKKDDTLTVESHDPPLKVPNEPSYIVNNILNAANSQA